MSAPDSIEPMTLVDHALSLAARGFHVFPLVPGEKLPAIEDWPNRATRDPVTIRQWWNADGDPLWQQQFNIGISCGKFGDGDESLCVLDVDNKDGKNGSGSLKALQVVDPGLTPHTLVQTTPSGGFHYVYRSTTPMANSASKLGEGLDIRATGGFIVAAGSIVEKGTYAVHPQSGAIALASPELIALCTAYVPRAARSATPIVVDETVATARVREYLKTAKPAVEGQGGNAHTFTIAARCKDLGTDSDTTLSIMLEEGGWNERCSPNWESDELATVVENAYAYGRNAQGSASPEAAFTPAADGDLKAAGCADQDSDTGLAQRFVEENRGKLLYCAQHGAWYIYSGARWLRDETNAARGLVTENLSVRAHAIVVKARSLGDERARNKEVARAGSLVSAQRLKNVQYVAMGLPSAAVESGQFDRDPMLLATPGGTVDLKNAQLRPATPADLITQMAGAIPGGDCPRWLAFLSDFTGGNSELIGYLRRLFGYGLTAEMREHVIVFLYGSGGNGKGVFVDMWRAAAGEYATAIPERAFLQSAGTVHAAAKASLLGKRVGFLTEVPNGARFDEPALKAFSSGDVISVNFMRENYFDLRPTVKIVISGNNRPTLSTVDDALRRRFHMVDCRHKPAVVNVRLREELLAELPGILQWGIEGAEEWNRMGLCPPAAVRESTDKYFESEDRFGQWLADRTELGEAFFTNSRVLFEDLSRYARQHGFPIRDDKQMAEELEKRGFKNVRKQARNAADPAANGRGYCGLRLLDNEPQSSSRVVNFPVASTLSGAA